MKRAKIEAWPKNAIGTKLAMFESTIVLIRSQKEWNAATSFLTGKPLNALDPTRLATDAFCGLSTYYGKSDRKETIFMLGVFDGRKRTFVHELGHIVFDICAYYNIPTEKGQANEVFCYLIEHLYAELEKYVKK